MPNNHTIMFGSLPCKSIVGHGAHAVFERRGTIISMPASIASPEKAATPAAWFLAIRPKTLPAALAPVLVGCAVAWAEAGFDLSTAIAAFAVALLLQIGANLANDVADFHRGADSVGRLGPVRVTQGGLIAPRQMIIATAVVLAVAAIPGLYLVWRGGPVLAALGLLAILAAVTYTAGPKPFGYLGLGEFFVFLFFGPVAVVGTAYAMMHVVDADWNRRVDPDGVPGYGHPGRQ